MRSHHAAVFPRLPLLSATPEAWAQLAAARLPEFLADHAICEKQAALTALNLVSHYPEDAELVERMTSLAVEEVIHLRRVSELLRRRGLGPSHRRANPWVQALLSRVGNACAERTKLNRLLVGALIEARSCERFTRLLDRLEGQDDEVASLLRDLGPAEQRHWEMFYALARRDQDTESFALHWRDWLEFERDLCAAYGVAPTVHG